MRVARLQVSVCSGYHLCPLFDPKLNFCFWTPVTSKPGLKLSIGPIAHMSDASPLQIWWEIMRIYVFSMMTQKPSKVGQDGPVFGVRTRFVIVDPCRQDYKSLCASVTIYATLVNIHTHAQTAFGERRENCHSTTTRLHATHLTVNPFNASSSKLLLFEGFSAILV